MVDEQAVDRVYRIGQKRDVKVYRLIAAGTVEESIFQKQVTKKSLSEVTIVCASLLFVSSIHNFNK